jgi:hypothetical protein
MSGAQVGEQINDVGACVAGLFNRSVIFKGVAAAKRASDGVSAKRQARRLSPSDRRASRGSTGRGGSVIEAIGRAVRGAVAALPALVSVADAIISDEPGEPTQHYATGLQNFEPNADDPTTVNEEPIPEIAEYCQDNFATSHNQGGDIAIEASTAASNVDMSQESSRRALPVSGRQRRVREAVLHHRATR